MIVTNLPLNSNKTPLRLETSKGLIFRRLGEGGLTMEFPWTWNIFKNSLINLCKGRVILEGVNIFLKILYLP